MCCGLLGDGCGTTTTVRYRHITEAVSIISSAKAVAAKTSDELAAAVTTLFNDETAKTFDRCIDYAKKLLEKSELWSSCYRDDVALRGHSTNNTVESSMRILKDRIFKRLKAFNLVQLVDFLVTRLEQYYERRLINVGNNRHDELTQSRYFPKDTDIALCNVWKLSADIVHVPSATKADISYSVSTALWVCTCPVGRTERYLHGRRPSSRSQEDKRCHFCVRSG